MFDEMAIKESVSYDMKNDRVSGLEDFGLYGCTKHVANHAGVFFGSWFVHPLEAAIWIFLFIRRHFWFNVEESGAGLH